jgi:hypothetical protein
LRIDKRFRITYNLTKKILEIFRKEDEAVEE